MKTIYILSLVVIILLMITEMLWLSRVNKQSNRLVYPVVASIFLASISYILAVALVDKAAVILARSMHSAATDVMLVALCAYLWHFCQYDKRAGKTLQRVYRIGLVFMSLIVVFDVIMLFAGAQNESILTVTREEMQDGNVYNIFSYRAYYHMVHMSFFYTMMAINFSMLLYRVLRGDVYYHHQYGLTALIYVAAMLLDGFGFLFDTPLEASMYAYVGMGVYLLWFPSVYVPRAIASNMVVNSANVMNNGVICFDNAGTCIYANNMIRNIFFETSKSTNEVGQAFLLQTGIQLADEKDENSFRRIIVEKNDKKMFLEVQHTRIHDQDNISIGEAYLLIDRTKEKLQLDKELYLLERDSLTGLYNRRKFRSEARKMLDMHPEEEYYIVCSDIKDFKMINELFGTQKGDEVLKKMAEMMRVSLKDESIFGRLERDHFAMLMPKSKFREEGFLRRIQVLQDMIQSDVFQMQIYVGVYKVDDRTTEVPVMCDRAFMALDTIKGDIEKRIVYYDESLLAQMVYEKKIVHEFDKALEDGQFHIFLQPQTDASGEMKGAEALVRWIHPENGIVSPGRFISIFEKTGLIYKLDAYVWEEVCKILKKWKEWGWEDKYISVNISAKDFGYLDIYKTFTNLVEKYEIDVKKLKLEITETALLLDFDKQIALIDRLRQYGFEVEIDDFGSGYSFLNMLKDIRVDVLKIDMLFLRECTQNERSKKILEMVISLSKALEMPVVVEGVEEEEQLNFLILLGCDLYQGYYFSKPIRVPEFEERYFGKTA